MVCCSNTMGQVRDTCTEDRNWTTVRMGAPAANMRWRRGVGRLLHGCRRCIISNNSLEGKKEVNSSSQLEIISTLNSVVNSTLLQNVLCSYPNIKLLQLDCYLSAASRTWIENLLPSPKRDCLGGQYHHRCDFFLKPSGSIIFRCFWDIQ